MTERPHGTAVARHLVAAPARKKLAPSCARLGSRSTARRPRAVEVISAKPSRPCAFLERLPPEVHCRSCPDAARPSRGARVGLQSRLSPFGLGPHSLWRVHGSRHTAPSTLADLDGSFGCRSRLCAVHDIRGTAPAWDFLAAPTCFALYVGIVRLPGCSLSFLSQRELRRSVAAAADRQRNARRSIPRRNLFEFSRFKMKRRIIKHRLRRRPWRTF